MYIFKFNDFNKGKNFCNTSHQLTGTKIKQLTKFVTFDTESTTKFYYKSKEITREEYNKSDSLEKYKEFYIKVISACYVKDGKYKSILYISGDSLYKKKFLKFSLNKFGEELYIKPELKYFENSDDMLYEFFNDIEKFNSVKNESLKIFCHNSKHDWLQTKLFTQHKKRKWELKNFRFSIPRFCTFNYSNKKSLIFLDTVNYFKTKLKNLGEEVGIIKQSENVDFNQDIIITEKFLIYSMVDSIILAEKLIQFNDQTKNLGTIGYGIASTAYNVWRTSFLKEKIWLHKNPCLMKLERKSYNGARTEAFKLGHFININGLDIKSSYPYQMLNELPTRYIKTIRATNKNEIKIMYRKYLELRKKYCLICEVLVNDKSKFPIIPYKYKGKLLFVNGKVKCVLTGPEIDLIIRCKQEIVIQGIHIYKKGKPFEKFSKYFYSNKEKYDLEGNLSLKNFYKLILNSCYGKCGEREIDEITKSCNKNFIGKIIEMINGKEYHFNCLSGIMKASKFLDNDSKNAFTPIASFIISYARTYLYEGFLKLGFENILYCDTDSIFTTLTIPEIEKRLNVGNKLGDWEIQYKNIDMLIYGVKDYLILKNGKILKQKLKGINLNDSIEENENEWLCERWTTINNGIKIKEIEHQRIINMKKILKREYTKSKIIASENKEIEIDGKIKKYKQCELKHFNIDELK